MFSKRSKRRKEKERQSGEPGADSAAAVAPQNGSSGGPAASVSAEVQTDSAGPGAACQSVSAKRVRDGKAGGKDNLPPVGKGLSRDQFSRPRWRQVVSLFGLVILIGLNISMVMSDLQLSRLGHLPWQRQLVSYGVLFLLDLTCLIPLLFEVDKVDLGEDELTLKMIVWRRRLKWQAIRSVRKVGHMVILRTARCFYLINKRPVRRADELAEIIARRTSEGRTV